MKVINGLMYFTKKEVAEVVGRTPLTIHNYATWSEEREKAGQSRFIPKPLLVGKYRYWNLEDIQEIQRFFRWLEDNRGAMKEYSQRCWTEEMRNMYNKDGEKEV